MSFDEVSLQFSRPSELPDVYTPVSISLWNQADMQALSLSQRSTVPVAFGDLELIDSNVSNSGKSKISVENAIEPLQLAQEQSRLSKNMQLSLASVINVEDFKIDLIENDAPATA